MVSCRRRGVRTLGLTELAEQEPSAESWMASRFRHALRCAAVTDEDSVVVHSRVWMECRCPKCKTASAGCW
jgi:hypothetical protein